MNSFQSFKLEIRLFLFVALIAVVVSVAGILLLKTMEPTSPIQQPVEDVRDEVDVTKNSSSVRLAGEVLRGQTFEKEIGRGLAFRLIPGSGGVDWTISIGDKTDVESNFAGVVTPPYRGMNYLYIAGWHFRNADNSGPNDGSVNAPQEIREFDFVLNGSDYQKAFDALQKMLWSYSYSEQEVNEATTIHEKLSKGYGKLIIRDLDLNNLVVGKQAGIESMKFEVELTFPEESQETDTSDWQTYRNKDFSFEVRHPSSYEIRLSRGYKQSEFSVCNQIRCIVFLVIDQGPLELSTSGPYQNYRSIEVPDYLEGVFYYYSIDTDDPEIDQILATFRFVEQ